MITFVDKNYANGRDLFCSMVASEIGEWMYIGVLEGRLCFVGFGSDARRVMERMFVGARFVDMAMGECEAWYANILRHWNVGEELELVMAGTEFQRRVWCELLKIERGRTVSYADIAEAVGTLGVRAVGSAVGRNPLSLIVPCHRVLRSGGALGGYLWGLELKQQILAEELR